MHLPDRVDDMIVDPLRVLRADAHLDEYACAGCDRYCTMVDRIRQRLGLTTLHYQTLDDLVQAWREDPAALPWTGGGSFDQLVVTAEMVGQVPAAVLMDRLDEDHRFIVGQLVPHMEAAEAGLYPALERLLQDLKGHPSPVTLEEFVALLIKKSQVEMAKQKINRYTLHPTHIPNLDQM